MMVRELPFSQLSQTTRIKSMLGSKLLEHGNALVDSAIWADKIPESLPMKRLQSPESLVVIVSICSQTDLS